MSYSEVHKLPITYRRWFLARLVKHFQQKNKAYETGKNQTDTDSDNKLNKLNQFEQQIKSRL